MPPVRSTRATTKPTKQRDCFWVVSNILSRMRFRNKSDKHANFPDKGLPSLRPLPLYSDADDQPHVVPLPPTTTQTVTKDLAFSQSSLLKTNQGHVSSTDPSRQASQASSSTFPIRESSIRSYAMDPPQALTSTSRKNPRHPRQPGHPYSQQLRYGGHIRDCRPLPEVVALEEALEKHRADTNKERARMADCMADLLVRNKASCQQLKVEKAARLKAQQRFADVKQLAQERLQLVAGRDKTLAERDAVILGKDVTIAAKDKELMAKDETIRRLDEKVETYKRQLQEIEDEKLKMPLAKTSYDALCEAQDALKKEMERFEVEKKRAVEAFHHQRGKYEVEKKKIANEHECFVKEKELLQKEVAQGKKALGDLQIEAQKMNEERERLRKELTVRAAATLAARQVEEPEDAEMRSASLDSSGSTSAAPHPFASAPRQPPATQAFAFPRTTSAFPPQTPARAPIVAPATPANDGFKFVVPRAVPTWAPDPALAEQRAARPMKTLPRRRMRPQ